VDVTTSGPAAGFERKLKDLFSSGWEYIACESGIADAIVLVRQQ